jgi:chromate reductase
MTAYKIAIIVGSLREGSINRRVAQSICAFAGDMLDCSIVPIGDLPLYNQDSDANPPDPYVRFREAIAASDGVLFVTPEYNRGVPGVLKNAIDVGSRPYGQSAWAGKPAAVIGVSVGAIGTSLAQQHLRNILAYLDMPTLGQPEMFIQNKPGLFTPDGGVGPDDTKQFLQKFVEKFADWVKHHADRVANK